MSQDKTNINALLNALQAVSKESGYDIWIPSLKKTVKFSDITTGQQKELIRALVDNPVYRTNFVLALYQILKNNCQDSSVDVNQLSILDKHAIAIQLRAKAIGSIVKVETDDGVVTVDINPSIGYSNKFVADISEREFVQDGVKLLVKIPSIQREVRLERELRSNLVKSNVESYDDVRNMLADAYVGELAKYIHVVTVGENTIDLSVWEFKQAYRVVEGLPATLVKQVVTYLEQVQSVLAAWSTYYVVNNDGGSVDTAEITVDAAFFAGK